MAKVASVVLTVFVCALMVKGRIFNTIDEGNAVHKDMVSGVATDFSAVGSIRMPASEKNIGTMDNLEDDVLRAPWRKCPCTCFIRERTALTQCDKDRWRNDCSVTSCNRHISAGHIEHPGYTCCS